MIPHDHITFNDDGTAWLAVDDPRSLAEMAVNNQTIDDFCIDGRHTFEIEVDVCTCYTYHEGWACADFLAYRVSVVPGMVLPIVGEAGFNQHPCVELVDDGTVVLWTLEDDNNSHRATHVGDGVKPTTVDSFPSAAAPGMWAVKLKVAP